MQIKFSFQGRGMTGGHYSVYHCWGSGYNPWSVDVGFVVDELAMGQAFTW